MGFSFSKRIVLINYEIRIYYRKTGGYERIILAAYTFHPSILTQNCTLNCAFIYATLLTIKTVQKRPM